MWTQEHLDAFAAAKAALSDAVLLAHPDPKAAIALTTDASDTAVGAVLSQGPFASPAPLAFFSKKLSAAEKNYSAFDKELLAVYLAVRHFRHYLEGRVFTVYTDHKPLVGAISNNSDRSPRQSRHLSYVSEFTTDFKHLPGKQNVVADALSRLDVSTISTPPVGLTLVELAAAQAAEQADMESSGSLEFSRVPFGGDGVLLWSDVSQGRPRPWIPPSFRRRVFLLLHGVHHPGARTTIRDVSARYVWKSMRSDLRLWTRQCLECQRAKVGRHTRAPLHRRPPPDRRFGSLHVDLVGPLPESRGCRYLFTVIDRFTRWIEAVPLASMTAEDCGRALVDSWVSRYGVPSDLVSDQGRQFISSLWRHLMSTLGIEASTTTAYHPQANGMVERFHRTLKERLMARQAGADWTDHLSPVLMGLRASLREDSLASPADLVFGSPLRLPGAFFEQEPPTSSTPDEFVQDLRLRLAAVVPHPVPFHQAKSSSGFLPASLMSARAVFLRVDAVRRPLEPPYEGPFEVLHRTAKTFTIRRGLKDVVVSVDHLKPCLLYTSDAADE